MEEFKNKTIRRKCNSCKGVGSIKMLNNSNPHMAYIEDIKCENCNGTGKHFNQNTLTNKGQN